MRLVDAERLAHTLMHEHGLTGWRFAFDRARRRFGCCQYHTQTISLSAPWTERLSDAHVRNTILHEIAHALVGPQAGHGLVWYTRARAIGCNGRRCGDGEGVELPRAFTGQCPGCQREVHRHRRGRLSCVRCRVAGRPHAFVWRRNQGEG